MSSQRTNRAQGSDLDQDTLDVIRVMVDDSQQKATKGRFGRKAKSADSEGAPQSAGKRFNFKMSHITLVVLALLVVLRPWLMLTVALLIVVAILVSIMTLGYDAFWKNLIAVGRFYARMRPSETPEINARLDRFVQKWDGFLDRFPEGSVDDLYMPDFGDLETRDKRHDQIMVRRLAEMEDK